MLLNMLGYAYVQFALDFVGIYDGRLSKVREMAAGVCVHTVQCISMHNIMHTGHSTLFEFA